MPPCCGRGAVFGPIRGGCHFGIDDCSRCGETYRIGVHLVHRLFRRCQYRGTPPSKPGMVEQWSEGNLCQGLVSGLVIGPSERWNVPRQDLPAVSVIGRVPSGHCQDSAAALR